MESVSSTADAITARRKGAAVIANRDAPLPRKNWLSRLAKSVADFFRGRRFSRNRAKLRPPSEPGRPAKH